MENLGKSIIRKLKSSTISQIHQAYRDHSKKQEFKNHLKSTDSFIVGHPKSGNTWLTLMLAVLLEKRFQKSVNLNNIGEFIPSFHARDNEIASYDHFPEPRLFRNEAPLYPDLYPKTIYILRDPRAALVSYYHHCVHDTGRTNWPIADFVDEMLTKGCIRELEPYLIRWDKHVDEWLGRASHQPVLVVTYEQMKHDRASILKQAADFIGIEYTTIEFENAIHRGEFSSMRQEELTYGAAPYSGTRGDGGFFVRKGKIDGWKEELTDELSARIVGTFEKTMKKIGYV